MPQWRGHANGAPRYARFAFADDPGESGFSAPHKPTPSVCDEGAMRWRYLEEISVPQTPETTVAAAVRPSTRGARNQTKCQAASHIRGVREETCHAEMRAEANRRGERVAQVRSKRSGTTLPTAPGRYAEVKKYARRKEFRARSRASQPQLRTQRFEKQRRGSASVKRAAARPEPASQSLRR